MATKRDLIKAIEAARESTLSQLKQNYEEVKSNWVAEQVDHILDGISEDDYRTAMEPLRLLSVQINKRIMEMQDKEGQQAYQFIAKSILGDSEMHSKSTLRSIMQSSAQYCNYYYIDDLKGMAGIERERNKKRSEVNDQFNAIVGNCSTMNAKEIETYLEQIGLSWIIGTQAQCAQKHEVMAPVDVKLIQQLHAAQL